MKQTYFIRTNLMNVYYGSGKLQTSMSLNQKRIDEIHLSVVLFFQNSLNDFMASKFLVLVNKFAIQDFLVTIGTVI